MRKPTRKEKIISEIKAGRSNMYIKCMYFTTDKIIDIIRNELKTK